MSVTIESTYWVDNTEETLEIEVWRNEEMLYWGEDWADAHNALHEGCFTDGEAQVVCEALEADLERAAEICAGHSND